MWSAKRLTRFSVGVKQPWNQKEKKFFYPKFGSFILKKRKVRIWRIPHSGKEIQIKAKNIVSFKPAQGLKHSLIKNGKVRTVRPKPKDLLQASSTEISLSQIKPSFVN